MGTTARGVLKDAGRVPGRPAQAGAGWLACVMEETGDCGGAGVAIGADGQRYMVLLLNSSRSRITLPAAL